MPVQDIVLAGFGSSGSKSLIVTIGFAAGTPPPVVTTPDLGGRYRKREDIEREQKLVNDYLDALDKVETKRAQKAPARAVKAAVQAVPALTQAMARAANEHQIREILERAAAARDLEIARAEYKRRYTAHFITLMLSD